MTVNHKHSSFATLRNAAHRSTLVAVAWLSASFIAGCGSKDQSASKPAGASLSSTATEGGELTGAGSTFAFPLYSRWATDYKDKTGVKVNYQSIGSGGGIRQFSEMTVDFGATDGPMTDEELSKAKGGAVLHIPTALGGVVLTYNLAELKTPVKLTADIIADIFLGKITKWNDARLSVVNPGAALPARDIIVVHRSEGSGTTFVLTDYLSATTPGWTSAVGKGKDVKWPVGLGGKGNEGVTGQIKQTPGSFGYVELAYANQNKLPAALVRNAAGNFVAPTVASITAAAAGVAEKLPANSDYRISIVNAPGTDAYPISSFTWILMYRTPTDTMKGRKLAAFVQWGLTDGQQVESSLDYAPLPELIVARLRQRMDSLAPRAH